MLNSVSVNGYLCSDPALRTTPAGVSVTTVTIAVDRNFVPKDGNREADFLEVTAWRRNAEFLCNNFKKGSAVSVHGSLRSRNYEDKDGNKRKAIEIVADDVSFCGPRPKD